MFPSTRLQVFVCFALGLAVQAAPASAPGAVVVARDDSDFNSNGEYDGGLSAALDENLGENLSNEINDNLDLDDDFPFGDDLEGGFDGSDDSDIFDKRQPVLLDGSDSSSGLLGTGIDLGNLVGGNADGSADVGTTMSGGLLDNLGLGDLADDTDLGVNAGLDASKRQILENLFGEGTGLANSFGLGALGGLSGGLTGGTSTSTSTDGTDSSTDTSVDGTTDDSTTDSSGLGSLLGGFSGSGSGSAGLGSSFGLKRQLGLGANFGGNGGLDINSLLQKIGVNGNILTGGSVSASGTDVAVTATATATATDSVETGTISIPTAVTATAGASATGTTSNGLDLNNLLGGLNLGNGANFGLGANAGANAGLGGLDLSSLNL